MGERPIAKARHTVGNRDGGQAATIAERILANARYTVGNRDGGQAATTVERFIANTRYTTVGWDDTCIAPQNQCFVLGVDKAVVLAVVDGVSVTHCYMCQAATTAERTASNARYTVGNRDGGQAATIGECTIANACHNVGNRDGGQPATTGECTIANARYTVWERDGGQIAATGECTIANARYTVWERDGGQIAATGKRPLANTRYTVGNRDGSQAFATGESPIANARYTTVSWDNTCLAPQNQYFVLGVDKAVVLAVVDGVSFTHCDTCQPAAPLERILTNARHTVGERDGGQVAATPKRPIPYRRNAIAIGIFLGDHNVRVGTASKSRNGAGLAVLVDGVVQPNRTFATGRKRRHCHHQHKNQDP